MDSETLITLLTERFSLAETAICSIAQRKRQRRPFDLFLASGQKYGSRHSRRKQQRTLFFIVQFLLFIANLRISSTILLMATGLSTMNSPRKTPVFPLFLSVLELLLLIQGCWQSSLSGKRKQQTRMCNLLTSPFHYHLLPAGTSWELFSSFKHKNSYQMYLYTVF